MLVHFHRKDKDFLLNNNLKMSHLGEKTFILQIIMAYVNKHKQI